MCELLNRIWSRPRGEWTRVLRRELPALAAEIVEELLHGIPGFSALVDDNDAIDDDLLRQRVEEALLSALGYRDAADRDAQSADPVADGPGAALRTALPAGLPAALQAVTDHGAEADHEDAAEEDRHDGRLEDPREGIREGVREPAREHVRDHDHDHDNPGPGHGPGHGVRHEPAAAPPDRARQELFRALTDDRTASESSLAELAELAEAAHWPLPPAVRAIALATPGETQQLAAVLDDSLAGMFAGRPCLLLPSPDPDARAALELPLRGRFAAVGHAVPLRDTASSLRWALRLLALTPTRGGLDARAVFVDDHLSTLLLLQDEPLAHALAARWLRPLADLTPRQSERLEVTLLAWLEGGGAPEAAKALSVHPQTVRYRMRQLEKLFGPGLRDPRTRFELEMALRSRRLMAQVRRQHSRAGRRGGRVVTADFTPLVVGRMARVNGL
ncbi:CdaR family transcriptional regulator [Streptomyces sp. NBC_00091]|uniref:PucR family transcriptional regulator n=1 Tax=Streptomyces sp. NBC_00091 TaxID=2975648 RepID=UPI00225A9CDD|nr:helix-turn-helix domain-containing protein [Streptomyces sp. NBC_00091]MCX5381584.1 helix-turn-helix domain-containing protein [Streptomyces sp. NBC_00091]